jgi:hypothetical protein
MQNQEELVTVQVPRKYLLRVYGFLSELEEGTGSNGPEPSPEGPEWNEALLKRAFRESSTSAQRLLKFLATRPERDVPTGDIAGALSLTGMQLAGVLGAFGRRCFSRYHMKGPNGTAMFPFAARWDYGLGATVYRLPQWAADVITGL